MDILSTKPRMRLIVSVLVVMLITAGFYFGTRWTTQENQYMHADWLLPLPIYLLGLDKKEMRALQEQLQAP